ncbi:hypothetical protein GBA65_03425 [Rubrobacter marinus]|uniref:Uncharacterized protein n=1 Tax=Rubrobacter marinus TaxID=2653852 RepID=A0A6G8PTG3_9ACTN|nr:hypothetical protein [Rubrobacter marinus]QIN77720.1 hypothetical protein GBA65_03425 [Rubrobacter marinus]
MVKGICKMLMWVGRGAIFSVGLAVVLALTVGLASTALAGTGVGAVFNLGQLNSVNAQSALKGATSAALLKLENAAGPALNLAVPSGKTPMYVSPGAAKVSNLDADKVDGKDSSAFQGKVLWAEVNADGTLSSASDPRTTSHKGTEGSQIGGPMTGLYTVRFPHEVRSCARLATLRGSFAPEDRFGDIATRGASIVGEGVEVFTADTSGAYKDRAFQVAVIC